MIEERMLKTHLIITDIHDEYDVNWCGKIKDTRPVLENNMPIFVVIGTNARTELNTVNMKQIEECAKRMAEPRGRESTTSATSRIYIKEVDGHEAFLGIVTHKKVKHYAPMYDKVGYRRG